MVTVVQPSPPDNTESGNNTSSSSSEYWAALSVYNAEDVVTDKDIKGEHLSGGVLIKSWARGGGGLVC